MSLQEFIQSITKDKEIQNSIISYNSFIASYDNFKESYSQFEKQYEKFIKKGAVALSIKNRSAMPLFIRER